MADNFNGMFIAVPRADDATGAAFTGESDSSLAPRVKFVFSNNYFWSGETTA